MFSLGSSHSSIQWLSEALFPAAERPEHETDSTRLRIVELNLHPICLVCLDGTTLCFTNPVRPKSNFFYD
jgi:hypothetical protein